MLNVYEKKPTKLKFIKKIISITFPSVPSDSSFVI